MIKLNPGLPWRKNTAHNKKKYYFQQQTGLKFKKETNEMLHLNYKLCAVLKTWALRNIDRKYLESFKCGAGEGWRRSVRLNE